MTQPGVMDAVLASEHPDLNKDRVELFLAALEGEGYTQCTGSLRVLNRVGSDVHEYNCALGVATHVALNNGLREELEADFRCRLTPEIMSAIFNGGSLSPPVRKWYGFSKDDPILARHNGHWRSIAGLNDSGWSFWDIAQAGRARWLKDQGEQS